MKKSLFAVILCASLCSSLFAADAATFYKIQVCTVPIAEIFDDRVREEFKTCKINHVFIRGVVGANITGLNFEPRRWNGYADWEARIDTRNHENAKCYDLYTSSNQSAYDAQWKKLVADYDEAARQHYRYDKNNSLTVTKAILQKNSYQIPMEISLIFSQQKKLLAAPPDKDCYMQ